MYNYFFNLAKFSYSLIIFFKLRLMTRLQKNVSVFQGGQMTPLPLPVGAHGYTVKYIRGSENVVADYFSRSNWDDHSTCSALWCVKSMYIVIVNMFIIVAYDTVNDMNMMWHYKCHAWDVKYCLITQCWIYVYKMSKKIIHYIILYTWCLKNIHCQITCV